MNTLDSIASALRAHAIRSIANAPLAKRTWWRVGGPADLLVFPESIDDFQRLSTLCYAGGVPLWILGNGSNVLIGDRGVRGVVAHLEGSLSQVEALDTSRAPRLAVGGGCKLAVLMAKATAHQWTGLEALAGIPGTMGGAVRMNAGTGLGETADCLESVLIVHADGAQETLPKSALALSYRRCTLPDASWIVRATLRTTQGDAEASAQHIKTFLQRRKATQPLNLPSCGSTFTNPPGDYAGRLIEQAGLKGRAIGGAQVSNKHANFVVNTGHATASNLRDLIRLIQARVHEESGVRLHTEVHFIGEF